VFIYIVTEGPIEQTPLLTRPHDDEIDVLVGDEITHGMLRIIAKQAVSVDLAFELGPKALLRHGHQSRFGRLPETFTIPLNWVNKVWRPKSMGQSGCLEGVSKMNFRLIEEIQIFEIFEIFDRIFAQVEAEKQFFSESHEASFVTLTLRLFKKRMYEF